jgi:hypothetical protein
VKLLGDVAVLKLHGDMRQPERTSSLVTFAKVCVKRTFCYHSSCTHIAFVTASHVYWVLGHSKYLQSLLSMP